MSAPNMSTYSTTLSVVVPTYKEIKRLPQTVEEIVPYLERSFTDWEIIVVDDGSPDGTPEYVRGLNNPKIKLIDQGAKIGKGAAVRRGCLAAVMDYVLYMDADHATSIEELSHFMPLAFAHPQAAVVGSRIYQEDEDKWRRILGILAQLTTHLIVFQKAVIDSQCGFKLFPRAVARRIFSKSYTPGGMFDAEIIYLMQKYKIPIYFEAVHWHNKLGSRINILACILFDPFELINIRIRNLLGKYRE